MTQELWFRSICASVINNAYKVWYPGTGLLPLVHCIVCKSVCEICCHQYMQQESRHTDHSINLHPDKHIAELIYNRNVSIACSTHVSAAHTSFNIN